jgi:hypothetical protein
MPRTTEPEWETLPVFVSEVVPAATILMSEPIYVGGLDKKTFTIKATGNTTVTVLFGTTPETCLHALKSGTNCDTEDTDRTWNCNNEGIAFSIEEFISWIVLVADNQAGANNTISADLS